MRLEKTKTRKQPSKLLRQVDVPVLQFSSVQGAKRTLRWFHDWFWAMMQLLLLLLLFLLLGSFRHLAFVRWNSMECQLRSYTATLDSSLTLPTAVFWEFVEVVSSTSPLLHSSNSLRCFFFFPLVFFDSLTKSTPNGFPCLVSDDTHDQLGNCF